MKRLALSIGFLFLTCQSLQAQFLSWQQTGDLPILANLIDGSFNPPSLTQIFNGFGDTVFATLDSEIYISTDRGSLWRDTKHKAPTRSRILLSKSGTWLQGSYRSINQGKNWIKNSSVVDNVIPGKDREYFGLSHRSYNTDTLFFFHSTDDGLSWTSMGMLTGYGYSFGELFYKDNTSLFLRTDSKIFRSSDNGKTWDSVFGVLPNYTSISFFATDGAIFYAGTDSGFIYTSISGLRDSWIKRNGSPMLNSYGYRLFTGTGAIYRGSCITPNGYISRDTGRTWKQFAWDTTQRYYGSLMTIDSSGTYYAGGGDYIFRSSDDDISWSTASLPVIDTGYHPAFPIVAGPGKTFWVLAHIVLKDFSDVTLYHSSDDGLQWYNVIPKGFSFIYSIANGTDGSLLAGVLDSTHHNVAARTSDGGVSWGLMFPRKTNNTIEYLGETAPGKILAIDDEGYCHYSQDNGISWDMVQTSFKPTSIYSFCIVNPSTVCVGSQGGFSISHDGGMSWKAVTIQPSSTLVTDIVPSYSGGILAVFDTTSVMRTTDGGKTWKPQNSGFSSGTRIMGLAASSNDVVYAATSKGVYFQFAGDTLWHASLSGLTDPNVTSITSRDGKSLFVSCSHSQIFRADNINGSTKSVSSSDLVLSVYPNPMSSSATVSYSLATHQSVKLELIDQLGRVIRLLRSENEDAGEKSLSFQTGDLPAGMYYLRLQEDDGMVLQKIIVTK